MRRSARFLAALAIAFASRTTAAQVFQLQGGGSTLMDGYGGLLNIWGNGYEGSIGIGYLDGWRLTATARRLIGHDTLQLGNDILALQLPTDLLGGSNGMLVQGAGLQRRRGRTLLHVFGGASASSRPAPFFSASRGEHALAFAHTEWDASRALRLYGDMVLTTRQSVFAGARWRPLGGLTTGATVGLGNNAPYGALSADLKTSRLDLKTVATSSGRNFRRSAAPLPFQSEAEGLNTLITWHATPGMSITAGQQHFRQDLALPGTDRRATLNQFSGNYSRPNLSAAGGIFESRSASARSVSSFVSARRDFTSWLQTDVYLLQTLAPIFARSTTPVLYLRERVAPQFSLLQVITWDKHRTSVAFGGTVASGLSSLGVDYQIVHAPYRTTQPLVQSLALNVRVHVMGYMLSVGSYVTPDGKVNYAANGSTFFYRGGTSQNSAAVNAAGGRIDRYLVRGVVQEEDGAPVEGAALDIGGSLVYTDSQGRFFLRRPTQAALPLHVLPDEFLSVGVYDVINAPVMVTPSPDSRAVLVKIVVRRAGALHNSASASRAP